MPVSRTDNIRIIPLHPGGGAIPGRGLDAYRAMPIAIAAPFSIGGYAAAIRLA